MNLMKLLSLPGIILAISMHEFAHAWMSDKLGDPTPARQGRLTISPFAHVDLLGLGMLFLFNFGWGKPVMIDPSYYKNRRRDEFLVSIAGVTMNLIIAAIMSVPTKLLFSYYENTGLYIAKMAFLIFYYTVVINLVLMVFNLIPVPPLDGWNIVSQLFNLQKYSWWHKVYQYGIWILLALILLNITDIVLRPAINFFIQLLLGF
ncbi:MAG TPA: site-2 protease family protein [Mogibacterium sp.]|nr:site-2 protease family protein [Mogibacterium sp.]